MIQSVLDDIKGQFRYGNNLVKIILVNLAVFLFVVILRAFTPGGGDSHFFQNFISWIALSSESIDLLKHPWSIITHMFLHEGIWHIFWNMLLLYWFGRIVGDLIGDKKVLPIYILGGLCGALFYMVYANFSGTIGIAYGASAAVMAFVVAAGFIAPEYNMRLILLGDVKLKYIALALVLIDIVMISEAKNTGGSVAHLGGAVFGGLFVYFLRSGIDLSAPFANWASIFNRPNNPSRKLKVIYKKQGDKNKASSMTIEDRVDQILDKINATGYESLTEEEKEVLYQASKK